MPDYCAQFVKSVQSVTKNRLCSEFMAKAKVTAQSRIDRLTEMNQAAELGGGKVRLEKQKADGKLTARERIAFLLDKDSFEEIDKFIAHRCLDFGMQDQQFPGDGVVSGYGRID